MFFIAIEKYENDCSCKIKTSALHRRVGRIIGVVRFVRCDITFYNYYIIPNKVLARRSVAFSDGGVLFLLSDAHVRE